jgi:hypothetical protein
VITAARPIKPRAGRHRRPRPAHRGLPGRAAAAALLLCGLVSLATGLTGLYVAGLARGTPFSMQRVPHIRAPQLPATLREQARQARVPPPAGLVIPAIGVRTRLIRLGLTAAGQLQVPATTTVAGWYTGSPQPGAVGAAVIAGHIDSRSGPGVFFRLRLLRPRDRIYVRQAGGTLAVFRVTAVRSYLKSRFPTGLVYGPVPGSQLRLITCGGVFDPALGAYLSNVVVFATAAGSRH